MATFASNSLLKSVMAAADAASGPGPRGLPSLPDADSLPAGLAAVAALQSLLARRLPQVRLHGVHVISRVAGWLSGPTQA